MRYRSLMSSHRHPSPPVRYRRSPQRSAELRARTSQQIKDRAEEAAKQAGLPVGRWLEKLVLTALPPLRDEEPADTQLVLPEGGAAPQDEELPIAS
jgi:hypothetical protein